MSFEQRSSERDLQSDQLSRFLLDFPGALIRQPASHRACYGIVQRQVELTHLIKIRANKSLLSNPSRGRWYAPGSSMNKFSTFAKLHSIQDNFSMRRLGLIQRRPMLIRTRFLSVNISRISLAHLALVAAEFWYHCRPQRTYMAKTSSCSARYLQSYCPPQYLHPSFRL
jgi:hypothetical protein